MPGYRDFQPSLRFQPTLALSPDGTRVAYVDDSNGQFNITVQSLEGGDSRRITSFIDSTVRRVAWCRDGETLIFLADTKGDENAQIYRVNVNEGEPELLTDAPTVQHEAAFGDPLSPDGTRLAYTANDRTPADKDVLIRDLSSGRIARVYTGGGSVHAGFWSPDGKVISVVDWVDSSNHIVYLVDPSGGPAIRVTPVDRPARYVLGPWLPDGSGFLVVSNSGRDFTGLAVMRASDGHLTWLDTPDWNVEEVALSNDGKVLLWTVNEDGASRLHGMKLDAVERFPVPALPMGEASGLAITPDGAAAMLRLSTPVRAWNIAVLTLATGEFRWLTQAVAGGAKETAFVEPILVHYRCRGEHSVPAHLYRPPGVEGRVGVVMSIHGGPMYQERPVYQYDGLYQYLLSQGVAVFAPNIRGSSGYGRAYQEAVYRDWGGVDLDDLSDAIDFLGQQDWVDRDRIGLYGGSYGGFLVLSCLARLPEKNWAAGVSYCGPSNLLTLAKASPPSWRSQVNRVIGDPDTDSERLLSISPVTFADQIRAPLFVIQGANDPRVPQSESDQIVDRLRARGRQVRYDVYPDEGHSFLKRANLTKMRGDAADFLIAHLTTTS